MAEAVYYLRSRGKITGPFDLHALRKMVTRGNISRIHEVSADRSRWVSAGDIEQLFPGSPAAGVATTTASPLMPPAQGRFYYSQDGATVGPVPMNLLRSLAQSGRLRPEDLVWQEEAEVATPARGLSFLAEPLAAAASAPAARAVPAPGQIKSHLLWSIVMTVLCPPVGLVALIQADKANQHLAAEDKPGALAASRRAGMWCWIAAATDLVALCIGGLLYLLLWR